MNLGFSLRRTAAQLASCILVGMLWASPAQAQQADFVDGISTAVGYTGVFPDVRIGAGFVHLFGGSRFGVFGEGKYTNDSVTDRSDYCPAGARPPVVSECSISAVQARWNDIPLRDLQEHVLINGGAVVVLTPELALMMGVGMARSREIREFAENIDRTEGEEPRVSEFGVYFVPEEESPGWEPQLVAGALFRAGPRLLFRVGYESAPGGMSLGGYLVVR